MGLTVTSAKKKGYDFNLSKEEFIFLIGGNCYYCGTKPETSISGRHEIIKNGIDRLDNGLGYTRSNVVSCCQVCNYAKNNMTVEEFRSWLLRATKFQAENGW